MIDQSDLGQNIVGIAIGIRFNPTFAIGDNLGKIADKILYSKNSYFNQETFQMNESSVNELLLSDTPKTRYLYVSATDIILDLKKTDSFSVDVDVVQRKFKEQILDHIFNDYHVREIQRIGLLTKYLVPGKDLSELFLKKAGVDANNISMRFQKNYPMPEAMFKKDVNDYCSNIYTITKKADKEEIVINSDYQIYFKPFVEDHRDINYEKFIDAKNKFNATDLPQWINQYLDR